MRSWLDRSRVRHLVRYLSNAVVARVPFARVRHAWYGRFVAMAPGANLMHGLTLRDPRGLSIGRNSNVNPRCLIDTRGGAVAIGDYCDISPEVNIWTLQHDLDDPDFATEGAPVTIEDYVWIGNRAIVLPGVTLHRGCVVAAGAVVTKSVEPFTIVGGVPARPIGARNEDQRPRRAYKPYLL